MKKYEIMYIVNASLDDAARQNVMERLHGIITSHIRQHRQNHSFINTSH